MNLEKTFQTVGVVRCFINQRSRLMRKPSLAFLALILALGPFCVEMQSAWALSEIQREDLPAPAGAPSKAAEPGAENTVPDAAPDDPADATPDGDEATPDAASPDSPRDPNRPEISENGPLPEISYDLSALPEPVRRTHDELIEACRSADIEKLRPLLGVGDDATQVSLTDVDGDVVEFLKQSSGDGKGLEILAILEEVLSAGYVHLDRGEPEELYVWPYFFAIPLDRLTGRQQVELFKIVTAGDVEEMKAYGAYIFYRIGITPQGRWAFFLAGD